MPAPAPLSPEWWTARLYRKLKDRRPHVDRMDDYYRGRHPFPWLPRQLEEIAQRILKMTRTNYMGLVIDAQVERLEVMGFRIGDNEEGDQQAWALWQANGLDASSQMGFVESAKCGASYLLAAPPQQSDFARLTIEHASQVILDYEPGELTARRAALKVWVDDTLRLTMATLYLPGLVFKWQGPKGSSPTSWVRREVPGETWPLEHDFGVPMLELPNNPQLLDGGISEIEDVTDIQDRINKTIADRLVTQDFGAFPQKFASGWELGEDEYDEHGNPKPAQLDIGRDRLVRATTQVTFGQFAAAPLDPYSTAKAEDVRDVAARTRTPPHYLLGSMINLSAEALNAAMDGLIAKCQQRQKALEGSIEEAVVLGLRMMGDTRPQSSPVHTLWRDPAYRNIAVLTDSIIKQYAVGLIPLRVAQQKLGYSPQEITRMAGELRAATALQAGVDLSKIANKASIAGLPGASSG